MFLASAIPGCSKAGGEKQTDSDNGAQSERRDKSAAEAATSAGAQADDTSGTATAGKAPASLPVPEVDPDAPTVDEKHPGLASAALVHARLAELPDGVLLRAADVAIRQKDIEAEVAQAPAELREQLRKNAFFLLEQMATQKLLAQLAPQDGASPAGGEQAMLQGYFQTLVKDAQVSDREIAEFYEQNKGTIGGAKLEQVKEQIKQYLLQQKQHQIVDQHIQTLARRTPVAVSAEWVKTQAKLARDNPVDKARASGIPTFANFGAEGCAPCDMMAPMREAIRKEYEANLNVVFVHVREQRILASRYGVRGIPLLIFFDADGKEVARHTGYMERQKVEEKLAELGVN
ncbi:MAG: thioredoxin family protein [Planctomycetota bacterium]